MPFLPVTRKEMEDEGLSQMDFVYVCGDAYVDHPSFGAAIISRVLEAHGYHVGMICQPDWRNPESIDVFGEPRLGFLVSSGNMDSMVNHYTVAGKHRHEDAYSPNGETGHRPDRAVIVYCNLIRRKYKKTPIVIGGIEASLRRMGHYDYWSDSVRRSILLESGADLISYGMGEHSIVEIADALAGGLRVQDITFIRGTVYKTRDLASLTDEAAGAEGTVRLPDFETICQDKHAFADSVRIQYENTDPFSAHRMFEAYDGKTFVVQNPPSMPLTQMEMDDVYALPYMRDYHPMYRRLGGIPAIREVKFSLTSNRGCFGGCNFCALTFHDSGGGQRDDEGPGFQGVHQRRGWADRGIPGASMQSAAKARRLCIPAVPVSEALPESRGRSQRLPRAAPRAATASRREEGFCPLGIPV